MNDKIKAYADFISQQKKTDKYGYPTEVSQPKPAEKQEEPQVEEEVIAEDSASDYYKKNPKLGGMGFTQKDKDAAKHADIGAAAFRAGKPRPEHKMQAAGWQSAKWRSVIDKKRKK